VVQNNWAIIQNRGAEKSHHALDDIGHSATKRSFAHSPTSTLLWKLNQSYEIKDPQAEEDGALSTGRSNRGDARVGVSVS
jgi:hypothetical protein